MNHIPVVIFEDNTSLRNGFEELIVLSKDFFVSGSYPNANNLLKKIHESLPHVILMDIQMPGMNGIEAVKILKNEMPELPVIMLTVFEDDEKIFAAICAGACGYLLKNTSAQKILDALTDALNCGSPMTPSIAKKVLQFLQQQNKNSKPELFHLTDREKDVLTCLTEGMSFKMIAAKLDISFETVRTHMKKVYEKLHVNSIQEAVSKAFRLKML